MNNIQNEAIAIAKKYQEKPESVNKIEMLRKLDASVTKMPLIASMTIGIIGALIFGVGMCCTMVWTDLFKLGIVVGILGIDVCGINFPLYKKMVAAKKEEIAPQILQLSREITENSDR